MLLKDKTVLITGASRGIGRAITLRFAAEGANVAFTYNSNHLAAQALLSELHERGVKAVAYQADAADASIATDVVTKVTDAFGKIDILVNNAGVTRDTLLIRMTEKQWDEVLDTNLKSAYAYTRAVLQPMMQQRCGSIISISSVVGIHGNAGQANYAASKAGLVALMQSVAREVGARGIRANCIAPGFIETDMTAVLTEEQKSAIVNRISLRRAGKPEDVAEVALFLASDMSGYVSGQVLVVDGAMA